MKHVSLGISIGLLGAMMMSAKIAPCPQPDPAPTITHGAFTVANIPRQPRDGGQ